MDSKATTNVSAAALYHSTLLAIAEKSVLVRMDTVETFRGLSPEKINDLVDEGGLRWVWNINSHFSRVRHLRFLALEVLKPETVRQLSLEGALRIILGETRQSFSCSDIASRLRMCRVTVYRLHHLGHLPGSVSGGILRTTRQTLEAYLRQTWVGGGK